MILILLGAFIYWRAGIIGKISPMKAIHGESERSPATRRLSLYPSEAADDVIVVDLACRTSTNNTDQHLTSITMS